MHPLCLLATEGQVAPLVKNGFPTLFWSCGEQLSFIFSTETLEYNGV